MSAYALAMTAAERDLLRAALAWARSRGVVRLPGDRMPSGTVMRTWLSADRQSSVITMGCTLAVARPGMPITLLGAACVGELLSMLASLGVIPAQFSRLGVDALHAHAEVCERYARHLTVEHSADIAGDLAVAGWASAWQAAADSARRLVTAAA